MADFEISTTRELEGNQQLELLQTTAVSTDESSINSTPLASSNPDHTPIVGMYDYKKVKKKTRGSKKMMMKQAELDLILNKYQKVFSEPTELPPNRIDNHKIDLISDSKICCGFLKVRQNNAEPSSK